MRIPLIKKPIYSPLLNSPKSTITTGFSRSERKTSKTCCITSELMASVVKCRKEKIVNQTELIEHLEMLSSALEIYDRSDRQFRCYETLMLAHGRLMPQETAPTKIARGKPKECFTNSQHLIFSDPTLTYVEGYATFKTLPIAVPHAWTLNEKGNVVDPTWTQDNRYYFGIALDQDWLLDFLSDRVSRGRNDHRAIFEGNYQEGHSFLFDGLPEAAFAEPMMAVPSCNRSAIAEADGR